MEAVDQGLGLINVELNEQRFTHVINNSERIHNEMEIEIDYDEYLGDPEDSIPQTEYNINLGTSHTPRFSCACHKLNLALRHAITVHKVLSDIIVDLNQANSRIRRSVCLRKLFRDRKSILRLENNTRWSSIFLMLESVKKAYDGYPMNKIFIT